MKKKKIFFICTNLKGGGVERMIINLLQHLNRGKYEAYLVLFEEAGIHLHSIPPYVKKIFLNRKNKISYIKIIFQLSFKLFFKIKPDIVVSFMILPNILTLLSSFLSFHKAKFIISVRNNPEMDFIIQKNRKIKKLLMKILYPFATHIIVISKGIKKALISDFGFNENKMTVVYNGINIKNVQTLAQISPEDTLFQKKGFSYITGCGRLIYQKGFPQLIKAFSQIADQVKIVLFIFGEGGERENLTRLIKNLRMEEKIFLPGYKANPFQYIAQSDIFILSSLFEGFGNVIVEAMACGTPVIATDCPFGPGEIIENGINGILIPPNNVDIMADTLLMLLKNKPLRDRLSLAGKERIKDFSVLKMVTGFEEIFSK